VSHEIIEVYPMGALPRKKDALATHAASWRRDTAAEKAAQKPAQKPARQKAAAKKAAGKRGGK
jgi:sarcosine oxidase subunit delta